MVSTPTAFTKTALSRIAPDTARRIEVRDPKTPGLLLQVTPNGSKSFYLYRRVRGVPTRIHLGGFDQITVEQARRQAAKLNGELASGIDPVARRRSVKGETTFGDLFDRWMSTYAKQHKKPKSWMEDERQHKAYLTGWNNRQLSAIKKRDVAALHTKLGARGKYQANRTLALLSVLFNYAIADGWNHPNPCLGVKRYKETSRERFLDGGELERLFQAIANDPDADLRDFLIVLLLTGARKGNVESMKWCDVNLDSETWTIPADESKNATAMHVVLPEYVVDILRNRDADGPYVFRRKNGKLPGVKKGWDRIREAAQLPGVRMHDLRRTLGSWQAAGGSSMAIIGKSLGHKSLVSTQVYARMNLDPVRRSVGDAAAAMLRAGGMVAAD